MCSTAAVVLHHYFEVATFDIGTGQLGVTVQNVYFQHTCRCSGTDFVYIFKSQSIMSEFMWFEKCMTPTLLKPSSFIRNHDVNMNNKPTGTVLPSLFIYANQSVRVSESMANRFVKGEQEWKAGSGTQGTLHYEHFY